MSATMVFRVQAYVKRNGSLAPGTRYDYWSAVEAEEAGELLSHHVDGVLVYAQDTDLVNEMWGEPVVFAAHGETPRVEY